jgi:hypothetical protein
MLGRRLEKGVAHMDAADTLNQAIAALKAGNRAEARRLLESILAVDRRNEQAWLWMSGVVDQDAERVICLENVLTLNPYNQRARKGLEMLGQALPPLPITPLIPADPSSNLLPAPGPITTAAIDAPFMPEMPPRPRVADYRLYITIVAVLSLILICTVIGILIAVAFFAPGP